MALVGAVLAFLATLPQVRDAFFGGRSPVEYQPLFTGMLVDDRLVVKLPAGRVAELISSGDGLPFDAGKGKPMKEWVGLTVGADDCRELVAEAMTYVGKLR